MKKFQLTAVQITQFHEDGFVIIRNFLNKEAAERLRSIAVEDEAMKKHAFDLNDNQGKKTKLSLWYKPGNDTYGLLTKSEKMVSTADALLDGDARICHFHSKLMQKEPNVGGAWEWHQDYGYWYKNEFLFPGQMLSIMIAITEANKENGCLQVIRGSHKLGRVEHGFSGEQVGASQQFVDHALDILELVYVELKPGDALVFHSNLLHRSAANLSDNSRWSLISVYNRASNKPYNEPNGSSIEPLVVVADEAMMEQTASGLSEGSNFLSKNDDAALK